MTNLVAVDTQKVFEVALNAHLLWSCPLQVVAVSALLLDITGPTALLGIATLLAVMPLVGAPMPPRTTQKKRTTHTFSSTCAPGWCGCAAAF